MTTPGLHDRTPHIVLVEDNPTDIILLRHVLEENQVNCDLDTAEDGGEALELIERFARGEASRPDLFVLDINLPRENGLEVLARLRSLPDLSDVPVVVLTNSDSPRERKRAESLGVRHFFNKPTDLNDFMEIGAIFRNILFEQIRVRPDD